MGPRNYCIFAVLKLPKCNSIRGKLPFSPNNRSDLFDKIVNTDVKFDAAWSSVSENCQDFVRRLLVRDYTKRLTAQECICHPWIISYFDVNSILLTQNRG